jgi:NitT/TauT family transport system substrate-binding protein
MKLDRIADLRRRRRSVLAPRAHAQDKVSLRLNWYLGGLHVPFYYGKERGIYAAEGIDLTINEGRGSANTVQVVAAGSDTFGLADSSSVILTASKGADVKSVMSLLNTTASRWCRSRGRSDAEDLEGKVAVTPAIRSGGFAGHHAEQRRLADQHGG